MMARVPKFIKSNLRTILIVTLVVSLTLFITVNCWSCPKDMQEKYYNKPEFKLYYANWCPHCKKMMPAWSKLESDSELNAKVTISKVDCAENRDIAKQAGVKTFPTMFLTIDNNKMKYEGERDYASMKQWVLSKISE